MPRRRSRKESRDALKNQYLGLKASAMTFIVMWPFDTMATRLRFYKGRIFEKDIKQSFRNYLNAISLNQKYKGMYSLTKSFFNIGFGWGLTYSLTAGALTLPMQTTIQSYYVSDLDANDSWTIALRALAGWQAGFLQLVSLHTLDSMKVKSQKNPPLFAKGSFRYFLTHQSDLRRGMGVVGAGSVTYFLAWHMKLYAHFYLKDNIDNTYLQSTLSALAFSITHIICAFPVNTVKTWVQGDTKFSPKNKTFLDKTKRTFSLSKEHIKASGVCSLYRGFLSRGSMHIFSFAASMATYDTMQAKMSLEKRR